MHRILEIMKCFVWYADFLQEPHSIHPDMSDILESEGLDQQ
jgi:hypothetical protein